MADETAQDEAIEVAAATVDCDGGGGALGHPKVYLHFDESRRIDCPYCGRVFVRTGGGDAGH